MSRRHRQPALLSLIILALTDAAAAAAANPRPGCQPGETASQTQVNTTERLRNLRNEFTDPNNDGLNIDAYIIPSEDAHYSEYPPAFDQRRGFISGFMGSAGIAVVTHNHSALWTDGRYFLEAEHVLDCNWILQRSGQPGVPSITEWLKSELRSGMRVGASPYFMSSLSWLNYEAALATVNITFVRVRNDLVDKIWPSSSRPSRPNSTINSLPMKFAGKTWQDKIKDILKYMDRHHADAVIVSSLDQTAWLFNIRASDIAYNPFFISYAIVEKNRIRLYIQEPLRKLTEEPTDKETTHKLYKHLNTLANGTCADGAGGYCVQVVEYNQIIEDVQILSSDKVQKIWISPFCNYAIYNLIPKKKRFVAALPIALKKAQKNEVEQQGLKDCHIRDAVALIDFLQNLEKQVKKGEKWTELSASAALEKKRREQKYNRGLSFNTISGSGPNGAVIHYSASNLTNRAITTSDVYLLDSGGQYLDGTTDVTRTFHFGKPSDFEKECYTRVLMGSINLAMAKWPQGTYGLNIDVLARTPIWDAGLEYFHGTGHGIGSYLSVHEGPASINKHYNKYNTPLYPGMFLSDEPGYYEDGKFGIRLETIVLVTKIKTKYNFKNYTFLGFEPVTFVPFEPNLIIYKMLNERQKRWLTQYHKLCDKKVGTLLKKLNKADAVKWLEARTQYEFQPVSKGVEVLAPKSITIVLALALLLM